MGTRRWFIGRSAGSLAIAGAIVRKPFSVAAKQDGTPAPEAEDDDTGAEPLLGTPIFQPAIDIVRAQEIAIEGQTGAAVRWIKLDGDDGVLHYDVVLDSGVEIEVDATTGDILETEQADDEDEEDEDDEDEDDDEGEGEEEEDDEGEDEEEGEEEGEDEDEEEDDEDADEDEDEDEEDEDLEDDDEEEGEDEEGEDEENEDRKRSLTL